MPAVSQAQRAWLDAVFTAWWEKRERERAFAAGVDDDMVVSIAGACISPWSAPGRQDEVRKIVAAVCAPRQLSFGDDPLFLDSDEDLADLKERINQAWWPTEPYNRTAVPLKRRHQSLCRDNFTCVHCGRKPPEVKLQIDHIIPVSRGGTNDLSNLQTLCSDCNLGKGAELEYEAYAR